MIIWTLTFFIFSFMTTTWTPKDKRKKDTREKDKGHKRNGKSYKVVQDAKAEKLIDRIVDFCSNL